MTDREKVIKGLECCVIDGGCGACPYDSMKDCPGLSPTPETLMKDALELLKAKEPIEERLNLCESCKQDFGSCAAQFDDIVFGNGTGNDNVIGCGAYVNRWKAQEPRVMTVDEAKKLERDTIVWYEHKGKNKPRPRVVDEIVYCEIDEYLLFSDGGKWCFKSDNYGTRWRCWTSCPTDAQREAVKWDG